jgi:hypothetical protein
MTPAASEGWQVKLGRWSAHQQREAIKPVWRLPLWDPYDKPLEGKIADLNNISGGLCFCAASSNRRRLWRISISMPGRRRQQRTSRKARKCRPPGSIIGASWRAGRADATEVRQDFQPRDGGERVIVPVAKAACLTEIGQRLGSRGGRVRRQRFWDRRQLKLRESLARLVCDVMRLSVGAASGDWQLSVV